MEFGWGNVGVLKCWKGMLCKLGLMYLVNVMKVVYQFNYLLWPSHPFLSFLFLPIHIYFIGNLIKIHFENSISDIQPLNNFWYDFYKNTFPFFLQKYPLFLRDNINT